MECTENTNRTLPHQTQITGIAIAMAKTMKSRYCIHRRYADTMKKNIFLLIGNTMTTVAVGVKAKPPPKRNGTSMDERLIRLCKEGRLKEAVQALHVTEKKKQGFEVGFETYAGLLQECGHVKALTEGKQVHMHMLDAGIRFNVFLATKLVIMYSKCGSLEDARKVFDKMAERNPACWASIITGYSRHGQCKEALRFFYRMQEEGVKPDNFIFPSVLKACASLNALEEGKEIHESIRRSGFEFHVFVASALIDMYAKCNSVEDAQLVFDKMPDRNVVSWNAMVAGYVQNGHGDKALKLFRQMQMASVKPNMVTIASVLPACAKLMALPQGKEIHGYVIRSEMEPDVFVGSALVGMYAKCRNLEIARCVFEKMCQRNVASWNAIIAAYAQNGNTDESLRLFHRMQSVGNKPDLITWTALVTGYAQNGQCQEALELFSQLESTGLKPNVNLWTSIIGVYAQNGYGDEALKLFKQMQLTGVKPDVISWNAMIAGYAQNGDGVEALKLFCEMQLGGNKPNSITITCILSACANLAALPQGREIHDHIIRTEFKLDVFVGSALVDMYAKCGSIKDAREVFDKLHDKNVVSWNAMIAGYAVHGHGEDALMLFNHMQEAGTNPDNVTFTGVLSACSHAGMVDEGLQYFSQMSQYNNITPCMEHYACIVDLLGRAGYLDKAYDLIDNMPVKPNACVLGGLLSACRTHCNDELGEYVAKRLFDLEPENSGNYVLLSNIYAARGRWDDVAKMRKLMRDKGVQKQPGYSWIEVKSKIHAFVAGDRSHPQTEEIYAMLDNLAQQMREAGFVPDKNMALYDIEDEQKELLLSHHSERLAISFGLLCTPQGTTITVVKNLRICINCHVAIKLISQIVGRQIVVRDANRFHHFKDGQCSCGEYW